LWNKIRNNPDARKEFLTKMYKYPRYELGTIFDKIPQTTSEDIVDASSDTISPISGRKHAIKEDVSNIDTLKGSIKNFLSVAMRILEISKLPKIKFKRKIDTADHQASFGRFMPERNLILVGIDGRHPVDVLRTLAHELVHYKQHLNGEMDSQSGMTGSDEENDANALAGIIMRNYNKKYPAAIDRNR